MAGPENILDKELSFSLSSAGAVDLCTVSEPVGQLGAAHIQQCARYAVTDSLVPSPSYK